MNSRYINKSIFFHICSWRNTIVTRKLLNRETHHTLMCVAKSNILQSWPYTDNCIVHIICKIYYWINLDINLKEIPLSLSKTLYLKFYLYIIQTHYLSLVDYFHKSELFPSGFLLALCRTSITTQ